MDSKPGLTVIIDHLVLDCKIGVKAHERLRARDIILSLRIELFPNVLPQNDQLDEVVCYDQVIENIQNFARSHPHIDLIETLAIKIADLILEDPKASSVWMKIFKPGIHQQAQCVGIEYTQNKTS